MEILKRINKAKIQILRKNSFFSYLIIYLTPKELKSLDNAYAGVDDKGNFYYSEEKTGVLSDQELEGVIVHEVMHLALNHMTRGKDKDHNMFNVATDLVINDFITKNGFKLPKHILIPNSNGVFKHQSGIYIKDCDKKVAEEIYNELMQQIENPVGNQSDEDSEEENNGEGKGDGEGVGDSQSQSLSPKEKRKQQIEKDTHGDYHQYSKGNAKEQKEIEKKWRDLLHEAYTHSKLKGDLPVGMERMMDKLHENKIDWKSLLNQYIIQSIPFDMSWSRPSKKSVAIGEYMPSVVKEKIEICVGIDVSGSIGQVELDDFMSEIIGIARAYQDRLDMRVYSHDTDAYDCGLVKNGNIETLKQMKILGGGGTSHVALFNKIAEESKNCELAIFFTDGESDLENIEFADYRFKKLFVISKGGSNDSLKGKSCQTIEL